MHGNGLCKCPTCRLENKMVNKRYYECSIHDKVLIGKNYVKKKGCPKCNEEKRNIEQYNSFCHKVNDKYGNDYNILITKEYIELCCKKHKTIQKIQRKDFRLDAHAKKHYCSECFYINNTNLEERCKKVLMKAILIYMILLKLLKIMVKIMRC